ncbi:MAG: hypothetical protein AAGD32_16450 [Planctomycetota bacterium]
MSVENDGELLRPIKRALLSVSDKTGLVEFAKALHEEFGVELLSTGGTARTLREAGLPVTDVSEVTGFPEIMAGRVKTLHPKIHGGILARRGTDDAVMAEHGIAGIDLVVVNLYPFEQTVAKPDVTYEEAVENIDIGGPAMVRAAAKNHRDVAVVVGERWYEVVLGCMRDNDGATNFALRQMLSVAAFTATSVYDRAIMKYLHETHNEIAKSVKNGV